MEKLEMTKRKRKLSETFLNDLKNNDGLLRPIIERVKLDHTLMLAIREDYINIYYRGGNIIKVKEQGKSSYKATFDDQYNKNGKIIPKIPKVITSPDDAMAWVEAFPHLKEIMDLYFSIKIKPEREF
jgi:hypothetical protein